MEVVVGSMGNAEEGIKESPPSSSSSSIRERVALRTGAGVSIIENVADDKTKIVHAAAPTPAPGGGGGSQLTYHVDRLSSCSWSPVLSPEDEKPFLPDLNVQYNMQVSHISIITTTIPLCHQSSRLLNPFPLHPPLIIITTQGFVFASNSKHSRSSSTPENDEVYRIRGKYPYVRYFSYTVYDMRLQTISTLHDTEVYR